MLGGRAGRNARPGPHHHQGAHDCMPVRGARRGPSGNLGVSLLNVYPYADDQGMGQAVVVLTDGPSHLAKGVVNSLSFSGRVASASRTIF